MPIRQLNNEWKLNPNLITNNKTLLASRIRMKLISFVAWTVVVSTKYQLGCVFYSEPCKTRGSRVRPRYASLSRECTVGYKMFFDCSVEVSGAVYIFSEFLFSFSLSIELNSHYRAGSREADRIPASTGPRSSYGPPIRNNEFKYYIRTFAKMSIARFRNENSYAFYKPHSDRTLKTTKRSYFKFVVLFV